MLTISHVHIDTRYRLYLFIFITRTTTSSLYLCAICCFSAISISDLGVCHQCSTVYCWLCALSSEARSSRHIYQIDFQFAKWSPKNPPVLLFVIKLCRSILTNASEVEWLDASIVYCFVSKSKLIFTQIYITMECKGFTAIARVRIHKGNRTQRKPNTPCLLNTLPSNGQQTTNHLIKCIYCVSEVNCIAKGSTLHANDWLFRIVCSARSYINKSFSGFSSAKKTMANSIFSTWFASHWEDGNTQKMVPFKWKKLLRTIEVYVNYVRLYSLHET